MNDISKAKLEFLKRKIRHDIHTSTNEVTDIANWLYTDIDGTKVLAIYSTEDIANPTLLYESKGKQAEFEKGLLIKHSSFNDGSKTARL